jgi:hypothetical protein
VCPCSLDQKEHVCDVAMEFSRCGRPELEEHSPSKLNSVLAEVDVVSRRAQAPDVSIALDIVIGRHNKRSLCDNR